MATPKQKYIRQLNSIADRYGKMEDTTVKRVLSMLKDLRNEISGTLTRIPADDRYEPFRLTQLRTEINALTREFERKLSSEVSSAIAEAQSHGAQSVIEPLSELGELDEVDLPPSAQIQGQFFRPMAAQANVALDFTAALIQNIVEPMRAKINRELQLAFLGRKSPFDTMRAVTDILGVEARASIWGKRRDPVKGVAARAEMDVRTELQRMYNLSHSSQQRAIKRLVPDLLKTWIATADMRTRRSHLVAHLTYRNNPIPVDEPFILKVTKGKNKGRSFELQYPGDPAGPPELVIGCRCKMGTVHPKVGVIGSSLDGRIAQEINRRGTRLPPEARKQESVRYCAHGFVIE